MVALPDLIALAHAQGCAGDPVIREKLAMLVCYTDTTIAMPLLTHYALAKHKPRKLKRLYDQRGKIMKALTKEYFVHNQVKMVDGSEPMFD